MMIATNRVHSNLVRLLFLYASKTSFPGTGEMEGGTSLVGVQDKEDDISCCCCSCYRYYQVMRLNP